MKVNKVIYLVLTAILGTFGVHKFYANKKVAGLIYLLLSWTFIPTFLSVIDFIIALFMDKDGDGNITFDKNKQFF